MAVSEMTAGRVLLIPDVHQHVAWVERVLAAGADCERVIFLGDYFDAGERGRASIAYLRSCPIVGQVIHLTHWAGSRTRTPPRFRRAPPA